MKQRGQKKKATSDCQLHFLFNILSLKQHSLVHNDKKSYLPIICIKVVYCVKLPVIEFHTKPSSSHKSPPLTYQSIHTYPCQTNTQATILTGPLGICNKPQSHQTKQKPCLHIPPHNLSKPFPSINPFSVIRHFQIPTDRIKVPKQCSLPSTVFPL